MGELALVLVGVAFWCWWVAINAWIGAETVRADAQAWCDHANRLIGRLATAEAAWEQGRAIYQKDGCTITIEVSQVLKPLEPDGETVAHVPEAFRRAFGE